MSDRRAEILSYLEISPGATLAEVAKHLGITRQGALRHLEGLEASGLVRSRSAEHSGPGRPQHSYYLTASASVHVPNHSRALVGELVEFLSMGELERFFAARSARLEAEYATHLAGLGGEERIKELARLATLGGHPTEVVEEGGRLQLRHSSCPIRDIATREGFACRHEQDMYARLLGSTVERAGWIGEGAQACTYQISSVDLKGN